MGSLLLEGQNFPALRFPRIHSGQMSRFREHRNESGLAGNNELGGGEASVEQPSQTAGDHPGAGEQLNRVANSCLRRKCLWIAGRETIGLKFLVSPTCTCVLDHAVYLTVGQEKQFESHWALGN